MISHGRIPKKHSIFVSGIVVIILVHWDLYKSWWCLILNLGNSSLTSAPNELIQVIRVIIDDGSDPSIENRDDIRDELSTKESDTILDLMSSYIKIIFFLCSFNEQRPRA